MTPPQLLLAFGLLLLLIGIVGGGFEVKEVRIPRVGRRSRILSLGFGSALVLMGSGVTPGFGGGSGSSLATEVIPEAGSAFSPTESSPIQAVASAPPPTAADSGLRRINPIQPQQVGQLSEMSVPIMNQLQETSNVLANEGFALIDLVSGALSSSQSETFEIDMETGFNYVLAGACDENCSDLDLEVRTPDGVTIASDYEPNDRPALRVTPGTGRFIVASSMYDCTAAPCLYGVALYRR